MFDYSSDDAFADASLSKGVRRGAQLICSLVHINIKETCRIENQAANHL